MGLHNSNGRWTVLLPVFAVVVLVVVWFAGQVDRGNGAKSLVVYCAHDSIYADSILRDFQRQTGIRVDVRYDTEATKSLGLVNLIIAERQQPRCDVFWNNELLGTVDLQTQGLLEPYRGSGWERLPEKYRDAEGHWVGFGARLRVAIINTGQVSLDEEAVANILSLEPSRAAVAKPLFGTTLTHYTVLWHEWGPDALKAWHHDLRQRGIREVDGNGAVKDVVAQGICDVGLTDTDDVFVALDDHLPVEMVPVRVGSQTKSEAPSAEAASRTICIPNTAAIIRGTTRLEAAQKLIDFLASADTELALARSKSRQVPVGPVDESQLPDEVRRLKPWADEGFDLRPLLNARRECLEWLKAEYLR